MKKEQKDIIFYLVIFYVLLAGGWWSYLLYLKNEDALNSKKELLWYAMKEQGVEDYQFYLESVEYTKLEMQYERHNKMILGEGLVLLLLTILGIVKIAKSRQTELSVVRQQRNFLLSITHELKSPLAGIKLVLQTLQQRKLNESQIQLLTQNALGDTERLHSLVNDLLLAARVGEGYQYNFEPLDLGLLLEGCVSSCQPKFKGKIELRNIDSNTVFIKKGDKHTLVSVVLNILGNAIKYAPQSEVIYIDLKQNKTCALIQIIDQGLGIDKEQRERIFEKFYRVGNEDTRRTKGTGLGLYIAKKIIKAHQGKIEVKDNQPQGTIFEIALPLN